MSDKKERLTPVSDRALEMIMRDVLDGMLELSLESAYSTRHTEFEIIEIVAEHEFTRNDGEKGRTQGKSASRADVLQFPRLRKAAC